MRKNIKALLRNHEKMSVFAIGAVGYGASEILCRGRTHWTMLLAGGICFSVIYGSEKKYCTLPLYLRCLVGSVFITCVEYIFGCVVNILLGWDVWDYSDLPLNIMGQISLRFFAIWFAFCFFIVWLCRRIRNVCCG